MATVWSILAVLAAMTSAVTFHLAVYPPRSGEGALRRGASVVMVGSGLLTVFALHLALGIA